MTIIQNEVSVTNKQLRHYIKQQNLLVFPFTVKNKKPESQKQLLEFATTKKVMQEKGINFNFTFLILQQTSMK